MVKPSQVKQSKLLINPWVFDKPFDPDGFEGFCYIITNTINGKQYIGKKVFFNKDRVPSNWQKYWGSNKYLLSDIKQFGHENFKREIISLHKTKSELLVAEIKWQFVFNVLESDNFYNNNIAGRYYRLKNKTNKPEYVNSLIYQNLLKGESYHE